MTTVALANRLLRYLTVNDLALLPAEAALELLDAINSALQQFYALCPSIYKRTTLSGLLSGAVELTLTVTNGSNEFTGYTFTAADKGKTIRIASDEIDNEIIAANGLLDVYLGTTGSQAAQVYGDVASLNTVIDRLTTHPILENGKRLMPMTDAERDVRLTVTKSIGEPRFYWIDSVGQSQGGDPAFLLRVDTLPDQDYRFRVDAELAAKRVNFDDLLEPATLALDDAMIESCILPMCAGNLLGSSLWKSETNAGVVRDAANGAREYIALLPTVIGSPQNKVGTPKGF